MIHFKSAAMAAVACLTPGPLTYSGSAAATDCLRCLATPEHRAALLAVRVAALPVSAPASAAPASSAPAALVPAAPSPGRLSEHGQGIYRCTDDGPDPAVLPASSPQGVHQLLAAFDRERRVAAEQFQEARERLAVAQQRYMRLVAAIATQRRQEGVLVGRGTLRG